MSTEGLYIEDNKLFYINTQSFSDEEVNSNKILNLSIQCGKDLQVTKNTNVQKFQKVKHVATQSQCQNYFHFKI